MYVCMEQKIVSECQTTILVKKRLKLSSNGSNNLVDIICQPYVMYDCNIYLPPYLCTSLIFSSTYLEIRIVYQAIASNEMP